MAISPPTGTEFAAKACTQLGDPYLWGVEHPASEAAPYGFDCSELVQWAANSLEVDPTCPDGSWIQAQHVRNAGVLLPIPAAVSTPGALLFHFSSSPWTPRRPDSAHVAISLGDGRVVEAASVRTGVATASAGGRPWTHAGLLPGVDYSSHENAAPHPTIRLGSQGTFVLILQTRLNALGTTPLLAVDGLFGRHTRSAVIGYQAANGLTADGIVGPLTWHALNV